MTVKTLASPVKTPIKTQEYMGAGVHYSIAVIRDEARQLVDRGVVSRQQPIYVLCQYIPAREWVYVERELEQNEYLLRDRISDLIGSETWEND